jgi:hypothetical protein
MGLRAGLAIAARGDLQLGRLVEVGDFGVAVEHRHGVAGQLVAGLDPVLGVDGGAEGDREQPLVLADFAGDGDHVVIGGRGVHLTV